MSFIVTLNDGRVAAMHGGIGLNSMKAEFLRAYGLSFDCRRQFKEGLHRLAGERVDLVMGNHPNQAHTLQKMQARLSAGAEILDSTEWLDFLKKAERRIDKLMQEDPE